MAIVWKKNGATIYNYYRNEMARVPRYVPTGTADPEASAGDLTYDDSFLYVKTQLGWKKIPLQDL